MKLLIHIHVFYADILPEVARCVHNFEQVVGKENCDIWATYPDVKPELESVIEKELPSCHSLMLKNAGYDIAAFIEVIRRVNLDEYDYVVKLHTKRNVDMVIRYMPVRGAEWRRRLLEFCYTEAHARRSVETLANNARVGMVAGFLVLDISGVSSSRDSVKGFVRLRKIGITPKGRDAVLGTMYMVRAKLLKPFTRFSIDDFDMVNPERAHDITGLASELEWAIPMSVSAQGYTVVSGIMPVWLERIVLRVQGFCYFWMRVLSDAIRLHHVDWKAITFKVYEK